MVTLLGIYQRHGQMPPSGLFVSEFPDFPSLFEAHQIYWMGGCPGYFWTMIIWAFGEKYFQDTFLFSL